MWNSLRWKFTSTSKNGSEKKGVEGLGVKALTMCRKSCLLIYFFKKLVGTFERNFCPRGENFNKAIFKSSNTWGAARKKREGYQRFQLIVILLIKGIKIKTIMWLSICIFLGKWCISDMKIRKYDRSNPIINSFTSHNQDHGNLIV